MKLAYLEKPKKGWCEKITVSKKYPRHWIVLQDMEIALKDDSIIRIPKGYIWDGASIPKWLWWLFNKLDFTAIWYLVHDYLYGDKKVQLEKFGYHIYRTRKFADCVIIDYTKNEPLKVRLTNKLFYFVIRMLGGFYYSRQFKIPN